jgi:hypothetical protein
MDAEKRLATDKKTQLVHRIFDERNLLKESPILQETIGLFLKNSRTRKVPLA